MISVAVCDDSSSMVDSMEKFLNRYASECAEEIRVIKFYSGDKLLKNYKSIYDVIFLDIKMPRMNGIEAAEKIREKDDKVTIIFLTSLLNRAVDGYSVKAANYIIKPMSYSRLKIEMDNWCTEVRKKEEPFLIINNESGSYKILLKSISFIETFNRNILIHTEKENIVSYQKMKQMESELSTFGFSRCHSSYIVNLFYVEKIEKMDIRLITSQKIPLSQTKKKHFMEKLAGYWGKHL